MTPQLNQLPWMDDDITLFRSQVRRLVEAEMVPRLPKWREQGFIDGQVWRARIQRIYGGTNELMKELIARKL